MHELLTPGADQGRSRFTKVITGGSSIRIVREKRIDGKMWMILSMEISYYQVKVLVMMSRIVNKLADLRGEEEDTIRFEAIKVTKEDKPRFRILGFEQMEVHCNMISKNGFHAGVWLGVNTTNYDHLDG